MRWGGLGVAAAVVAVYIVTSLAVYTMNHRSDSFRYQWAVWRGQVRLIVTDWANPLVPRWTFRRYRPDRQSGFFPPTFGWNAALGWSSFSIREQRGCAVPLWPIGLASGAASAIGWWSCRRRPAAGICPSCNYDLSGLPPGSSCPECAAKLTAPPHH
jgi:hypothetical protein